MGDSMPHAHLRLFCGSLFGLLLFASAAPNATASQFVSLYSFCPGGGVCADGAFPVTGLTVDPSGNLFGVTSSGGANGTGAIFELVRAKSTYTFQSLHSLGSGEGQGLVTPLILDTGGNLYGTTETGGAHSGGLVFELSHDATGTVWTFHDLYDFCSQGGSACTDGSTPLSRLTYAGASDGGLYDGTSPLYGTTTRNGAFYSGSIFHLTLNAGAWNLDTLYSFCLQNCAFGNMPIAGVTLDASGNIFGTTMEGGQFKQGVAYELADSGGTWAYSDVHDFCASKKCHDGAVPTNALVSDTVGNFYGTASAGGEHRNAGLIFKLAPDGTYTPVYNFCTLHNCADGALPQTDLLMASGGTLYGVTTNGGGHNIDEHVAGGGMVFAFNGSTLQTLYSFCAISGCRDGKYPMGGLIMDAQGNIFGTTSEGGKHDAGVVFELSP